MSDIVETTRQQSNEAKSDASGICELRENRITDSKTPNPPGAAGTTSPITQAKENEDINFNCEINVPTEKAFKQDKNPKKRTNINNTSTKIGL